MAILITIPLRLINYLSTLFISFLLVSSPCVFFFFFTSDSSHFDPPFPCPASFMGCGISKLDLDHSGQGSQITTLHRRNYDKEDETGSGKSVSSATGEGGSGFLKRVVGSNEKERGTCSPRKDIISIPCFKQPQVEIMVKDAPKEKKSQNDNNGEENLRPSNAEDCGGSILRCPGSPSFRVYCENDFTASSYEDSEEEREENKSNSGSSDKGEMPPARRGRLGRGLRSAMQMGSTRGLKNVLQRGGSLRMKNILNGTACMTHPSSPSHESTAKLIPKAV